MFRGEWTTYGELGAAATGARSAARLVARLASDHPGFANAHRVLASGGRVAGEEAGARRRRARLEAEGVAFNGRTADPARRVGWVELRGRLFDPPHEIRTPQPRFRGDPGDPPHPGEAGHRPTA